VTDPRVQQLIDWVQARQGEGGPAIGPDTDLFASGALDSMGLVSLFFMIETMGGRTVDPAEVVAAGPITPETIVKNWW
jgi:acyl carrier protein